MTIETVVCVPGPWRDRDELVRAVAALLPEDGPRFLMAGAVMVEVVTEGAVQWSWEARAPQLRQAFEVAGRGGLSKSTLGAVERAPGQVFLIDPEGGDLAAARRMLVFAEGLLRVGGHAVKVESAGVAHDVETWREMTAHAHDAFALYSAFVVLVGSPDTGFFSCGMHNLGHPEVAVPPGMDPELAAELMDTFCLYLLTEEPELEDGQTFAVDDDAPVFELEHGPCVHFPQGDPFHNPFGVWTLVPVED